MPRTPDEQIDYWREHGEYLEGKLSEAEITLAQMTAYARALEDMNTLLIRHVREKSWQAGLWNELKTLPDLRIEYGIIDDLLPPD